MLELLKVTVTLGKEAVLSDVSFSLREGRITALLGKNGSGKTTLFRAINREVPYTGEIMVNAQPLSALAPKERAQRISLFPQILPSVEMSVAELVMLGRTPHLGLLSRPTDLDRRAVAEAMAATATEPLSERSVCSLSGGERQRAYLAMLLAQEAPLVLLDEPTTYLDADARKQLLALLFRLSHEHKKTVLCVLHDLNDAIRVADDILLLEDGRLTFSGSVNDFLASDLPVSHFGLSRHDTGDGLPFYY